MLDQYKETQPIAYRILKNAIKNDEYSHAYIFETNGFYDSFKFIMAFTKTLLCPQNKSIILRESAFIELRHLLIKELQYFFTGQQSQFCFSELHILLNL